MRRAFLQAVTDLTASIDWRALLAALEEQNVEAAVEALNITPSAFTGLYQSHQAAFVAGATETVATLGISGISRADAVGIRFDMTNPRAEAWLSTTSSEMIKQVTEDTKRAAREAILRGYEAGRGPRDIATDIAGRVVNGRREGGVVGLDADRAYRLDRVTSGSRTAEGVQDLVIQGRDGKLRLKYKVNADTEKRILAAYKRGTAVSEDGQRIIADRFRNHLLKHRADTIAQVETSQAVMSGRREQWDQTLERLGRSPDEVVKTWRHGSGGSDPRPDHVAMSGKSVQGLDTLFPFSGGVRLRFAHDPRGAAKDVIRCTCDTTFRLPARAEDLR